MTDINFYVSKQAGLEHRLAIAYRLVNLALKHNFAIHIHTDTEQTSQSIDKDLWCIDRKSFIPHQIITAENERAEQLSGIRQIHISHQVSPLQNCDYLINLSNQRPDFFSRFKKVAEILDNSDEIITAGRKRYAFYRERGYTLGYHQM